MIVLDTDVLSGLRRRNSDDLQRFLAELPESPVISVYTVAEVQFGIAQLRGRDPDFTEHLAQWLDHVIETTEILPFDVPAARLAGRMRATEGLSGLEGDLIIAATALAAGAAIATLNLRDFRLIARHFPDLHVVDPLGAR